VIQAYVGGKIVARERLAPIRRNVLETKSGKVVGGGDITRKKKLLDGQREGQKAMKSVGSVELSPQVFMAIHSVGSNTRF
jgi:GTP-binding protein LepA